MYSDEDIRKAFDVYNQRIEKVNDILKLAPLNSLGISTIVHIGKDFQSIDSIIQKTMGGVLFGTIENQINICRELLLSRNPKMPRDNNLINKFVDIPLEVQNDPFFFVYYEKSVYDCAVKNSKFERKFKKSEIRSTKKAVKFYLTSEKDVNSIYTLRIRLI